MGEGMEVVHVTQSFILECTTCVMFTFFFFWTHVIDRPRQTVFNKLDCKCHPIFCQRWKLKMLCSTSPALGQVKCDFEKGRAKNREKGAQHCDAASPQVAQFLGVPFCD